jgi:hypothetical protein
MTWRGVLGWLCATSFLLFNAMGLYLTFVWLRFEPYMRTILESNINFTIPGSPPNSDWDTIDPLVFRSLPYFTLVLWAISSALLFGAVRLLGR